MVREQANSADCAGKTDFFSWNYMLYVFAGIKSPGVYATMQRVARTFVPE